MADPSDISQMFHSISNAEDFALNQEDPGSDVLTLLLDSSVYGGPDYNHDYELLSGETLGASSSQTNAANYQHQQISHANMSYGLGAGSFFDPPHQTMESQDASIDYGRLTGAQQTLVQHESFEMIPPQEQQYDRAIPPSNDLLFRSFAEAQGASLHQDWHCPLNDPTLPSSDIERQHWVLYLINAISNTTDVIDNKDTPLFRIRWFHPENGPSAYYPDTDKELVAWQILAFAESLHRNGPSVLTSFEETFWQGVAKTSKWTFAQRMNAIGELLMYSKARCQKLMTSLDVQHVVAIPTKLKIRTGINSRLNQKQAEAPDQQGTPGSVSGQSSPHNSDALEMELDDI